MEINEKNRIYYCINCNDAYSISDGNPELRCPTCGRQLFATKWSVNDWRKLSKNEKEREKQKIKEERKHAEEEKQRIKEERKHAEEELQRRDKEKATKAIEEAGGYWEYKVISLADSDAGAIEPSGLELALNELGRNGWRLKCAYANEVGRNTQSSGAYGISTGTNATIDQNILVFERFVKMSD